MVIREGWHGFTSDTRLLHTPPWGCFLVIGHSALWLGVCDGVYEVLIEVWCNWDPRASDLEEIDVLRCGRALFGRFRSSSGC